ncbi:hypothetical protein Anapl_06986 [Anas platyrhynchos]|uniref:Uncharacterized protein n=1 Tax=Anas platyrhynchos TaxID=8839 RepID=R0KE86_ANAPL|nr:hypothetical protein Anapl_06986 [Anas platyrhynchos]
MVTRPEGHLIYMVLNPTVPQQEEQRRSDGSTRIRHSPDHQVDPQHCGRSDYEFGYQFGIRIREGIGSGSLHPPMPIETHQDPGVVSSTKFLLYESHERNETKRIGGVEMVLFHQMTLVPSYHMELEELFVESELYIRKGTSCKERKNNSKDVCRSIHLHTNSKSITVEIQSLNCNNDTKKQQELSSSCIVSKSPCPKYTSGYIDIRQLTINQHETPKCGQRRVGWQHSCSTAIGETFIHTTLSIPLRILSPVKGRAYRAPFSNGYF